MPRFVNPWSKFLSKIYLDYLEHDYYFTYPRRPRKELRRLLEFYVEQAPKELCDRVSTNIEKLETETGSIEDHVDRFDAKRRDDLIIRLYGLTTSEAEQPLKLAKMGMADSRWDI